MKQWLVFNNYQKKSAERMIRMLKLVLEIAQKRWNEIRDKEGWTKEDAVVYALEKMDDMGRYVDPTIDEYQELIDSLV